MTDQQLQLALAKMLPKKIYVDANSMDRLPRWKDGTTYRRQWPNALDPILDTEWLHVCWLVEQILKEPAKTNYINELAQHQDSGDLDWKLAHATWQQRAKALCEVKGITV